MKKPKLKISLFILSGTIALMSCGEKKTSTEEVKTEAVVEISEEDKNLLELAQAYFKPLPKEAINPKNAVSAEKIALGKQLYFDPRLSKSGTISCNSCHNLASGGVDNLSTSVGHKWTLGGRNSPTSLNAALHTSQFWDGRAKDVEEQATMPVLNPIEMAIAHEDFAVERILSIPEYKNAFEKVFAMENAVSLKNIGMAIGAFERTLLTPSAFDEFLEGNANALSEKQKAGLTAFIQSGCTSCHSGELLGGNSFQKFGVYQDYWTAYNVKAKDNGKFDVTKDEKDKYVFKVPSLRNILETYPYFHDGEVWDIKEAIGIMGKTQLNKEISDENKDKIVDFFSSLSGELSAETKTLPTLPKSTLSTSKPDFN
jgi:cytochrome c peroxidase